jgi:Domain of unknown function (DUF1840)
MLYKFKSKATGDLIMLGPNGDALLRVLGREPSLQGIIEPQSMPAAVAAIEHAVAEDEALRRAARPDGAAEGDEPTDPARAVPLRQRLWPMVEMLRRAHAAREPIVWGV